MLPELFSQTKQPHPNVVDHLFQQREIWEKELNIVDPVGPCPGKGVQSIHMMKSEIKDKLSSDESYIVVKEVMSCEVSPMAMFD